MTTEGKIMDPSGPKKMPLEHDKARQLCLCLSLKQQVPNNIEAMPIKCSVCRPAYPKILLSVSVLQTSCDRIFRFFPRCTTNQSKWKCVKGQFFYHSSCKNSVWTYIFNYTDALQNWHTMIWMPLFCLHLLKSFWVKDPKTIYPKAMHCVYCFRWCWCVLSWMVVVWLELVSLVSWILPPLRPFCAVTCHRQLRIQTRHTWRWLASNFRKAFNAQSMFIGLKNF